MSFTFNAALTTDISKVRARVGDTTESGRFLEDETITAYLTEAGNVGQAAILCCEFIIGQLSRNYDRSNLGMSATRSQQITQYQSLLRDLRTRASLGVSASFTGQNLTNRATRDQDATTTAPRFEVGAGDNSESDRG